MWAILPFRQLFPQHMRHALGSADICFSSPVLSQYFVHGNVHPIHRSHKSPYGGLFQPAFSRLPTLLDQGKWIHIFPEARVHQHPAHQMRYFKWGISRLLLETEIPPAVVPMWIEGFEQIMHESRGFPRFLPRVGKKVVMIFGDELDPKMWDVYRKRWRELRQKYGDDSEELRTGEEATKLRVELTTVVRGEVEKLRRARGWPEEDEGAGTAEFYEKPGMKDWDGRLADGTYVKDT
ncbi:hypothetical protein EX30DRAFT_344698 [Ascodesmis nigricans]|uniref:Tafazzin family protein n=1 Tax=Ascodesmis nigricans TaxID=341454 RepID=A0A4S2MIF8_9PEZI|nr:hypothetical protein EX30DRAFT_344698 [Ascodesmis nigricans]